MIDAAGAVVGAGWMAGPGLMVTCAHVVTQAGGGPGRDILLRAYPHSADPATSTLAGVVDPASWRGPDDEDVAFVTVTGAPASMLPLLLDRGRPADGRSVLLFGFPMQALDRGHHGFGTVGGDVTGNAGQRLLQLTGCHEVTSGFSGGPVVDSITGRVIGMVDSVPGGDPLGRGRTTAYVTPVQTLVELWPGLSVPEMHSPFNGLDAFTEDRAAWFVGRDRAVSDVLTALGHSRQVLALLGPSGSGKSSLALAGVCHALAENGLPGSSSWGRVVVRTTDDPYARLAEAGLDNPAGQGLAAAARAWLAAHPWHDRMVIVLDQFEELLAQPVDGDAARFLAELSDLADQAPTVTILLVVRDDFYAQLTAAAPVLTRAKVDIAAALTRSELTAIVGGRDGVAELVEPGLVERVVGDAIAACPAVGVAGVAATTVLPLLEFTLTTLWHDRYDRSRDGLLTLDGYEALGGVTGCLARWCDDTMAEIAEMPGDTVTAAARMLTALVRSPDRLTGAPMVRRPRPMTELQEIGAGDSHRVRTWRRERAASPPVDAARILDLLTHRRIVGTGRNAAGDAVVDLVHDSLITNWQQLRGWLTDHQRFLEWQDSVEPALADWLAHTQAQPGSKFRRWRGRDLLLTGRRLSEAEQWRARGGLRPGLAALVDQSRRHRRRRRGRMATAAIAVVTLGIAATGIITAQKAEQQRAELVRAAGDLLIEGAEARRLDRPGEAVRWGLTAYWAYSNGQRDKLDLARRELVTSLAASSYRGPVPGAERHTMVGAGGQNWLLTIETDGTVALRDEEDRGRRFDLGVDLKDFAVATFVPPRKLLALVSSTGTLRLWNLADRAHPRLVSTRATDDGITAIAAGPDGNQLFLGDEHGAVSAWTIEREAAPERLSVSHSDPAVRVRTRTSMDSGSMSVSSTTDTPAVTDMAVRPDGRTLVTLTTGNRARRRDGGQVPSVISGAATTWSVFAAGRIRPSGTRLLPPLSTAGRPSTEGLDEPVVKAMRLAPDGRSVAIGGSTSAMLVAATGNGSLHKPTSVLGLFGEYNPDVQALSFSDDSRFLAMTGADQTISIWEVAEPARPTRVNTLANAGLDTAAVPSFSADGRTLYVRQPDGAIARYRTEGVATRVTTVLLPEGARLTWMPADPTRHSSLKYYPKDGPPTVATEAPQKRLTVTGSTRLGVWTTEPDNRLLAELKDQDRITALDLTADGTLLAVGTETGRASLIDLTDPRRPQQLGAVNPFLGVVFDAGQTTLPSFVLEQVSLSHDRQMLAVGTQKSGIYVYDITDVHKPRLRAHLTGPGGTVRALRFSPDDSALLAGSSNGPLWIYRSAEIPAAPAPTPTATTSQPSPSQASTAATPAATARSEPSPLPPAEVTPLVVPLESAKRDIRAAAYSAATPLLATADSGGTISLWDSSDTMEPRLLGTLHGPLDGVASVAFDHTGLLLTATDGNRRATAWSVRELAQMVVEAPNYACRLVGGGLREQEWRQQLPSAYPYQELCGS
ncbi:nSTAND1 domain-containing NTPase [Micromonospora ureilytica]|uniref:WD40 repeat protein n=1 Tax=Micromonospora ureilytica TaxID=709868 RepID=A0ABS0JBL8_9ACTN|nr:trypsin-like peptidase domain-containing protein [Micromonospora ureilytica]MBG6063911.1 WD40 repeat protein [Micromonospora ureilytica]